MGGRSSIEWTDATWNPITGCALVSEGCRNCYAATLAATRLRGHSSRAGLARVTAAGVAKWTGEVRFNAEWLDEPLRWRRPRRIFVCAHGDLFAAAVPDEWIDRIFAVMAAAPRHVFQVLTKRPARARDYLAARQDREIGRAFDRQLIGPLPVPVLPNVWLGASIEDQASAAARIPALLEAPAAVRFVSAEPLLGPVDLENVEWLDGDAEIRANALTAEAWIDNSESTAAYCNAADGMTGLDWVIAGGESGAHARPAHPDWVRALRDQCQAAGVPFLFKQWGAWKPLDLDGPPLRGREREWFLLDARGVLDLPDHRAPDPSLREVAVLRVGKKAAGRLLDGRLHDAMPAVPA